MESFVLHRSMHASCFYFERYIDDVFLTCNEPYEKLNDLLDRANASHPNIKLIRTVGKCLPFLDVEISNIDGNLFTSVFHKDASEPYVVPFASDHPRHVFANIIQGALVRAMRYSSTLNAFNRERLAIKLMLLSNG